MSAEPSSPFYSPHTPRKRRDSTALSEHPHPFPGSSSDLRTVTSDSMGEGMGMGLNIINVSLSRRQLLRLGGLGAALLLVLLIGVGSRGGDRPLSGDLTAGKSRLYGGRSGSAAGAGVVKGESWWSSRSWMGQSYQHADTTDDSQEGQAQGHWVDFDDELPGTTYDGGLPGYQVFTNLYLSGSTLLAITPSSPSSSNINPYAEQDEDPESDLDSMTAREFPKTELVVSKKNQGGEERFRVVDEGVGREEVGRTGVRLGGVTYIFNDGPGGEGYLVYFRHFVLEAFLGATRVLASTLPEAIRTKVPQRVWFPRCGADPSWRDDRGENAWFLAHALPFASIEDASGWADRNTAGLTVLLEKVVIIDRWASHSVGGEVGKWGKMNAAVPTVPVVGDFWAPFRHNMVRSLGADGASDTGSRGLPVVVYVDRQKSDPKVRESDHAALVEALKGLTNIAEVHVARLSGMTKARQVELMSRAQIIIGLHGDELMSSLWMPATEGSTVIEIFEKGGFTRDYELLATSLNHRYIPLNADGVIGEEEWRAMGGKTGEERKNGEISVDSQVVLRVLRDILDTGSTVDAGFER